MDYLDQLKALIGVPGDTSVARYPVSEAMIHHWCDAIGDENPIYTDASAAAAQGLAGPVAPLTMLQAWTMPGLKPAREVPGTDMVQIFEEAGFAGVVATNCDQEYVRYIRPGDVIRATQQLESVSELKKTALGEGHFVTQVWKFSDADDRLVGTMRFRMLFFRPRATSPAPQARRPRPAMTRDTEFFWKGAEEGVLLVQQCAECEEFRHPPGPMCPRCRSLRWNAVESSGRGVIYSYVRHYHPNIPPFEPGHSIVLVELEEGVRVVADLVGEGSTTPSIGQPVAVEFNRVDEELVLPQFRIRKD